MLICNIVNGTAKPFDPNDPFFTIIMFLMGSLFGILMYIITEPLRERKHDKTKV